MLIRILCLNIIVAAVGTPVCYGLSLLAFRPMAFKPVCTPKVVVVVGGDQGGEASVKITEAQALPLRF